MKFIRVEVEHRRTLALVEGAQRATQEMSRQQAKVAATGNGQTEAANIPGSQGVFMDRAGWCCDLEGMPGRFRDAVANAWQWKHARVVAESQLGQDHETPVLKVADRELGGTKPDYRLAGKVLEPDE